MSEQSSRPDVNRASREELVSAGVFPRVADRILRQREEHGPIRDESDLYRVVRDNEMRLDQLLGLVQIDDSGELRQGYST